MVPVLDAPNSTGFDGRIRCANLADLVQFECLSNDRVAITVRSGAREGHLFFERGELVHAVCEKLTGRVAAFEILGWETGTFGPSAAPWPLRRTVDLPWQTLLMFAAQQKDEMLRDRPSDGAGMNSSGLVPRPVLRSLPEIRPVGSEAVSAARISRGGDLLAARGDGTRLAVIGFELRRIADAIAEDLGLEGFSGLDAEFGSEQLLFFADTQESDVVLTAPRGTDLTAMRRALGGE